ncbi:head decoration protein [Delftia lacustris]|uniref:head decoration protein n=1 Tax=Delftia lacustris TaxID=558537 RepID=UPI0035A58AC6
MTTFTEGPGSAGYLISESNGTRSREVVTLLAGNKLLPGAVLGRIAASDKYTQVNPGATDGSEKAAAVLFSAVDATDADHAAVVTARDAEVAAAALILPATATTPQKTAVLDQLASIGIVAR